MSSEYTEREIDCWEAVEKSGAISLYRKLEEMKGAVEFLWKRAREVAKARYNEDEEEMKWAIDGLIYAAGQSWIEGLIERHNIPKMGESVGWQEGDSYCITFTCPNCGIAKHSHYAPKGMTKNEWMRLNLTGYTLPCSVCGCFLTYGPEGVTVAPNPDWKSQHVPPSSGPGFICDGPSVEERIEAGLPEANERILK